MNEITEPSIVPDRPARAIGRVTGRAQGPLMLVVGGLHGNEPAGVIAAEHIVAALASMSAELRGDLVALRGNLRALAAARRFLDRDLNRGWSGAHLAMLCEHDDAARTAEDREQVELWAAIEEAIAAARGPVTLVDLHTTSADGVPFAMIGDDPGLRELVMRMPLPVIEGLFGRIQGTLLDHLATRGVRGIGIEGGQNERPGSAAHHEAMLWLLLTTLGLLPERALPDPERQRALLIGAAHGSPRRMRVHHRHALWPQDGFRMEPGFANLQRVRAGELLARDRHGEIRAPERGVLLMPLYQTLGDDGFFLGREVEAAG